VAVLATGSLIGVRGFVRPVLHVLAMAMLAVVPMMPVVPIVLLVVVPMPLVHVTILLVPVAVAGLAGAMLAAGILGAFALLAGATLCSSLRASAVLARATGCSCGSLPASAILAGAALAARILRAGALLAGAAGLIVGLAAILLLGIFGRLSLAARVASCGLVGAVGTLRVRGLFCGVAGGLLSSRGLVLARGIRGRDRSREQDCRTQGSHQFAQHHTPPEERKMGENLR
jgi:hypothetical protein